MKLFEPITIRGIIIRNRIVMAPVFAGVGLRGRRAINYYVERARGGVGAIIVGATFTDVLGSEEAWGGADRLADFIEAVKVLPREVKGTGAKIGIQLVHMNRHPQGLGPSDTRGEPIAPSPRRETDPPTVFLSPGEEMRQLSIAEIETIVGKFGKAAKGAKQAGFDFVELHSTHGYLVHQFFSPLYNRRTDKYGGNLEGRMRFGTECLKCMREMVGADYPIFVRIGAEETQPGGVTLSEGIRYAIELERAGADVIDVSLGDPISKPIPTSDYPMGTFVYLAAAIKQKVKIPVITVGRINRPEVAETILRAGKADLIAIGRQLIADPYWPQKVREGAIEDITPCLSCNACLEVAYGIGPLRCAVNSAAGREEEYRLRPAEESKKVFIVGGGPAGMEAARIASLREHQVTLYEKEKQLGGQLNLASVPPYKEPIGEFRGYLSRQLSKSGANVILMKEATTDLILKERPDVVILATGAKPFTPEIKGIENENVALAEEILTRKRQVKAKAAIIGGELVACEVAEFLADQGKEVTILRRGPEIAMTILPYLRKALIERLAHKGVKMLTGVKYEEITPNGIIITDRHGKRLLIKADMIILAAGARPNQNLFNKLIGKINELYLIGDAVEPRRIREAIHDAARVARQI